MFITGWILIFMAFVIAGMFKAFKHPGKATPGNAEYYCVGLPLTSGVILIFTSVMVFLARHLP